MNNSGQLLRLLCLLCCSVLGLPPLTNALISSDSKSLASNMASKIDVVEGSGSPRSVPEKNEPQVRPDAEFQSSGASPDDEDGDVAEGSGAEVEGSGAPAHQLNAAVKTTALTTTTTTPSTIPPTTAKPRLHQFNEERRINMEKQDDDEEKVQPAIQRTTTTTTRSTPLATTTRPPPPVYGSDEGESFEMLKPGILAAVSGGAVVGVLLAILLVMFIIYRMRKKDEGSYSLDEPHQPPNYSYAYQKASTKEFYA